MISLEEPYDPARAVQLNTILRLSGLEPAYVFGERYDETALSIQKMYWKFFLIHVNEQLFGAKS